MKHDLENYFYEKYPSLFRNKDKSIQESCMAWGLEIGDGWHDLLDSLCNSIVQYESDLKDTEYHKVRFDQVKEKFGGLRVYFSGGDDFVEGLVHMAESMSYNICEVCGSKGSQNEKGWISTLCDLCRSKERT